MRKEKLAAHTKGARPPDSGRATDDGLVDVQLYLYPDTIHRFEALGPDWRDRMAEVLNKAKV